MRTYRSLLPALLKFAHLGPVSEVECARFAQPDSARVASSGSTSRTALRSEPTTWVVTLVLVAALSAACTSGSDAVRTPPTDTLMSTLPVNVGPEDNVDPAETAGIDRKDVVTRATQGGVEGVLPQGVGTIAARVTSAEGEVCEVCLWLADDDATRQRGLMGVTDLGDAVGMAFRWDQPTTGNFFMFQTPTPLSIAWFDAGGSHVGQADMEPCLVADSATCERYGADAPYTLGVEMFGGQLSAIGIGPGASIELLDLACL